MAASSATLDTLDAKISVQTLGDFGLVPSLVEIQGVTGITGPNATANERVLTNFRDRAHTSKPGKPKYGDVALTLFDVPSAPAQRILEKMLETQETREFRTEAEQRTLLAETGTTGNAARLVSIAAASATTPARATFSGGGFGTSVDIGAFDDLAPGNVIVVAGTPYTIYEHMSDSVACVVRLDEQAIVAVATPAVFSVVRPQTISTFTAWVSALSRTLAPDEEASLECTLMLSGAPTTTREVT